MGTGCDCGVFVCSCASGGSWEKKFLLLLEGAPDQVFAGGKEGENTSVDGELQSIGFMVWEQTCSVKMAASDGGKSEQLALTIMALANTSFIHMAAVPLVGGLGLRNGSWEL